MALRDIEVRTWPAIGVVLAIIWLFVQGVKADATSVAAGLLTGLLVGLPVVFVFRRLYVPETRVGRHVRVAPYGVLYVLAFLWEVLTANIDVALRVLRPSMPIHPEVIVLPLRVETDAAVTTIANSITLTPGTVTMDHDEERNALYVHAIDGRDPESVIEPIRTWEDYALVIFSEEKQPSDPAPDFELGRPDGDVTGEEAAEHDTAGDTRDVGSDRTSGANATRGSEHDTTGDTRDAENGGGIE